MIVWQSFEKLHSFVSFISPSKPFHLIANRDFKVQRRDGNENVASKVNLCPFSLHRNYAYPLTLSNVVEPCWS